jgi:hypothetical protein
MANAHLFFRTINSAKTVSGCSTSTALLSKSGTNSDTGLGYDEQVLAFGISDYILESISESYDNNVIDIPVPTSDGTRKINKQENGIRSRTLTIRGIFKNDTNSDIKILERMRQRQQVDTTHKFGIIGFYSPNADRFSLDPDGNAGYTISSTSIGFAGQSKKRYDFTVVLSFGGTVATVT